ncbi:hypothetical protein ACIHEI_34020 [Kitasatospora sp. NPDC051984]|uniref:hypothetical protein n=1 Tax=Kitasatospora sp. NPDC051984 TaxID=3364059 RepID=UPI0037CC93E9
MLGRVAEFFGFGSSAGSASGSGTSGGTSTRTTGISTTGWHTYDPATAQRHHREAQVSLPAAEYNPDGTRKLSPKPDPQHVNRSFWRS